MYIIMLQFWVFKKETQCLLKGSFLLPLQIEFCPTFTPKTNNTLVVFTFYNYTQTKTMYLNTSRSASLFYILTITLAIVFPEKFLNNKYVITAFLSVGVIFLWAIYSDAKSKK